MDLKITASQDQVGTPTSLGSRGMGGDGGSEILLRVSYFAMNKLLAYCSSVEGSNIQISLIQNSNKFADNFHIHVRRDLKRDGKMNQGFLV